VSEQDRERAGGGQGDYQESKFKWGSQPPGEVRGGVLENAEAMMPARGCTHTRTV
jgi:hypothetical protein